ncbi:MAG: DNA/RNA nuclease SfsA [Lachnospiraceae bacterium]|nr:DNA/RNA nuclease SfsA [Lachnospiraceae bacterium]
MRYQKIKEGIFLERPNRFIAKVEIDGAIETVHVKNTGRCKEILKPGVKVILEDCESPARKTRYDLVSAYKEDFGLINIDSQMPGKVVKEWLETKDFTYLKPEYTIGKSRIDFYMEKGEQKYLMEVKGCTLEKDGIGFFPDAPTERGVKHLKELTAAVKEGYHCMVAFVIQMEGIHEVRANTDTHPAFGEALEEAKAAGVNVLFLECKITPEEITIFTDCDIE